MKSEYLNSLRTFYRKNKRIPSYSEMLVLFGLSSKNAIHKIVNNLVRENYLQKLNNKLSPTNFFFQVPILGNIKAGFPTGAEEELNFLSLDEYLIDKPNSSFLLKVSGDSMEGVGIFDGDMVVIEKTAQARSGNIVLALIDNEWTLKILDKQKGKSILRAANPNYPEFIPMEELKIFGTVKSVMRKY
jgi:repressor LexA